MMTIFITSILFLLAALNVHGFSSVDSHFDGDPATLRYPQQRRRTSSHLPKFSKEGKGKGKGKGTVYNKDEDYVWVYEKKSDKASKSSKKGKKDKSEKYDNGSRMPTRAPHHAPPDDSKGDSNDSSEDCPPARPPTTIPPPNNNPTSIDTPSCPANAKVVVLDSYAIDYTLSQGAGALSKANFRELQVVTEDFFKNHMINAYKLSTLANLCDFTAPFVTAQYTTGEPVHVQYNSSAYFGTGSLSIPTADTLLQVLKQSVEPPKDYTDELMSKLSENNPFATTTTAAITNPKAAPTTRSAKTRSESMFGIAGASAMVVITLAIFVGVARRRKDYSADDDDVYNIASKKQDRCDTTVAGETFVSDFNDSLYDASISIFPSPSVGAEGKGLRNAGSADDSDNGIDDHSSISQRIDDLRSSQELKPRSVAEIEKMLSSWGYDGVI